MKEVEVKFKVKNFKEIENRLKANASQFLGQALEITTKFDTPDSSLQKNNRWLRIRTGFKTTLTLKEKLAGGSRRFKEREETELEINDAKKMEKILQRLGLTKKLVMEKIREKWRLGKTEIVLDKLPFGNFIEIEGSASSIKKIEKLLG